MASYGRYLWDSVKGIVGDPLSLNLYIYCQGNPVRYRDPSGHWATMGSNVYDERIIEAEITAEWTSNAETTPEWTSETELTCGEKAVDYVENGLQFMDELGTSIMISDPIPNNTMPYSVVDNLAGGIIAGLSIGGKLIEKAVTKFAEWAGNLVKHQHHTILKEIQRLLPPEIRNHADVIGRKGLPNKTPVEAGKHLTEVHAGPGGGLYNERFKEEIKKRGGFNQVAVKDVLEIRDTLVKEFNLK